jgi:hypothetical protein
MNFRSSDYPEFLDRAKVGEFLTNLTTLWQTITHVFFVLRFHVSAMAVLVVCPVSTPTVPVYKKRFFDSKRYFLRVGWLLGADFVTHMLLLLSLKTALNTSGLLKAGRGVSFGSPFSNF